MGKKRKLTVRGARIGENRARPEPRPERPKARKIAKKGPTKTINLSPNFGFGESPQSQCDLALARPISAPRAPRHDSVSKPECAEALRREARVAGVAALRSDRCCLSVEVTKLRPAAMEVERKAIRRCRRLTLHTVDEALALVSLRSGSNISPTMPATNQPGYTTSCRCALAHSEFGYKGNWLHRL